jgi:hypothetical protein
MGDDVAKSGLIFGQFGVAVLVLLAMGALDGYFSGWILGILAGFVLLALSVLVVLAYALWRPTWVKTRRCAAVLIAGLIIALWGGSVAGSLGRWMFLTTRGPALEALAHDALECARIHQISENAILRGKPLVPSVADTSYYGRPWADGIYVVVGMGPASFGLDPAEATRYSDFEVRLGRLNLRRLSATPEYVAFVRDGFLDNLQGLLYMRRRLPLPTHLHRLPTLVDLRHFMGNWYVFTTT